MSTKEKEQNPTEENSTESPEKENLVQEETKLKSSGVEPIEEPLSNSLEEGSVRDPSKARSTLSLAMKKAKVIDPEDTALLNEGQISELNKLKPSNLPKLDPSRDFCRVSGMGKTQFMPLPECWDKIRLIHKISITEGAPKVIDIDGNSYYTYQAKGYRVVGNDRVYGIGTKTINFEAKKAEKTIAAEEKLEKRYFKSKAEADRWRQKEHIRIMNFGMEMCETGAQNRLTRKLTGYSSGIADDAERKMIVSEMDDVAQIVGGDRGVTAEKSKAISTLFWKAGELGWTSGDLKKMIQKDYGVSGVSKLAPKEITKIARNLKSHLPALAAGEKTTEKKEEPNGPEGNK